ncbi:hypothetical protein [Desulfonatronum parangueonense]
MNIEPLARSRRSGRQEEIFWLPPKKIRNPKGFTPIGDVLSPTGRGHIFESSFFPAFKNCFLGDPGALSDQRERAVLIAF